MKIAYLNAWGNGSTANLVQELRNACHSENIDTLSLYGRGNRNDDSININTKLNFYCDALLSRFFDNQGRNSYFVTKYAINCLEEFNPDVIHIHNLHGYWINYKLLFKYIKAHGIPVVWTMHDSWAITGHCAVFQYLNCNNRKKGCGKCPGIKNYPKAFYDRSRHNLQNKRKVFEGLDRMQIVTPSRWLANQMEESFLNKYPISVIHNQINTKVFAECEYESLYDKYHVPRDKKIVLYVAMNTRDPWKGFDIMRETIEKLDDIFFTVVVGECSIVSDKKVLNVGRIKNQNELAAFYSMANVLANPSLDDNFPSVNLEALACGLPVVAFTTGGIPEQVDKTTGYLTENKSSDGLIDGIKVICENGKEFYSTACKKKYAEICEKDCCASYIDIYKAIKTR